MDVTDCFNCRPSFLAFILMEELFWSFKYNTYAVWIQKPALLAAIVSGIFPRLRNSRTCIKIHKTNLKSKFFEQNIFSGLKLKLNGFIFISISHIVRLRQNGQLLNFWRPIQILVKIERPFRWWRPLWCWAFLQFTKVNIPKKVFKSSGVRANTF